MGKTLKWSYILYGFGNYRWMLVTIGILDRGTVISHGFEIVCLLSDPRTYDHESCNCSNSLSRI